MLESQRAIFNTVPNRDFLSLYHGDRIDYKKVTDLLDFNKKELARVTGVPIDSIRFDQKMPKELTERLREWAIVLQLVAQFFEGDKNKTVLWFRIPNPLLGNITPRDMIRFGRFKKLLKFIQNALSENLGS